MGKGGASLCFPLTQILLAALLFERFTLFCFFRTNRPYAIQTQGIASCSGSAENRKGSWVRARPATTALARATETGDVVISREHPPLDSSQAGHVTDLRCVLNGHVSKDLLVSHDPLLSLVTLHVHNHVKTAHARRIPPLSLNRLYAIHLSPGLLIVSVQYHMNEEALFRII